MERKYFLAAAAGIGTLLGSAATALAVPSASGSPTPSSGHTWRRNEAKSNHNIREVRRHLDRVIDELQHDQHDYGGHRVRALDLLNQARQELLLAEQAEPKPGATAHPM